MVMSWPVVANNPYFGLNLTVDTKCSCTSTFLFSLPKFMSQILTDLSSDAEYRYLPVGCSARLLTQESWPMNTWSCSPFEQLKSLIVLSRLAERMNSLLITVWPFLLSYACLIDYKLTYFLNRLLRNSDPARKLLASPYTNNILSTTLSCPFMIICASSLSIDHSLTLWSVEQLASIFESFVDMTCLTQSS